MKIKYLFFAFILFFNISSFIVFAQETPLAQLSGCTGLDCSACNIVEMANGLIKWLIGILFLLFAVLMMIAGVRLVTSAGNPSALSDAKDKFINAIVGFLIILAAWLIVDTIMKGLVGMKDEDGNVIRTGALATNGNSQGWLYWSQVECQEQITPEESDIDYIDLVSDDYDPSNQGDNPPIFDDIPNQPAGEICYQGDGSGPVCFPAVTGIAGQSGYEYPSGFATPTKWIDTQNLGPGKSLSTKISPNYTLGQLNVSSTCGSGGRYMYIDPGAVSRLEQVNAALGTRLAINSAHRSPDCNQQVGGAPRSSHMSGKAFDMQPGSISKNRVMSTCRQYGAGYVAEYSETTHVHCDWQ